MASCRLSFLAALKGMCIGSPFYKQDKENITTLHCFFGYQSLARVQPQGVKERQKRLYFWLLWFHVIWIIKKTV